MSMLFCLSGTSCHVKYKGRKPHTFCEASWLYVYSHAPYVVPVATNHTNVTNTMIQV